MVLVQLGLHFSLKRHIDNSAGSSLLSVFPTPFIPLFLSLKHCGEQAQTPLRTHSVGLPLLHVMDVLCEPILQDQQPGRDKKNAVVVVFPACDRCIEHWCITNGHNVHP